MVGWMGGREKHLDKYAAMWRDIAGVPAASQTQAADDARKDKDKDRVIVDVCRGFAHFALGGAWTDARRLGRTLSRDEAENGEADTVFHVFSNRGMLVLLLLRLTAPAATRRVKGIVYDSCPGRMTGVEFVKAVAAGTKDPARKAVAYVAPLLAAVAAATVVGWRLVLGAMVAHHAGALLFSRAYHETVARTLPCPSLFVYSTADELVASSAVESVLARRRALNASAPCDALRFTDSAHCAHGVVHADEYRDALRSFLRERVSSSTSSS